jgi:hypothetical protein
MAFAAVRDPAKARLSIEKDTILPSEFVYEIIYLVKGTKRRGTSREG